MPIIKPRRIATTAALNPIVLIPSMVEDHLELTKPGSVRTTAVETPPSMTSSSASGLLSINSSTRLLTKPSRRTNPTKQQLAVVIPAKSTRPTKGSRTTNHTIDSPNHQLTRSRRPLGERIRRDVPIVVIPCAEEPSHSRRLRPKAHTHSSSVPSPGLKCTSRQAVEEGPSSSISPIKTPFSRGSPREANKRPVEPRFQLEDSARVHKPIGLLGPNGRLTRSNSNLPSINRLAASNSSRSAKSPRQKAKNQTQRALSAIENATVTSVQTTHARHVSMEEPKVDVCRESPAIDLSSRLPSIASSTLNKGKARAKSNESDVLHAPSDSTLEYIDLPHMADHSSSSPVRPDQFFPSIENSPSRFISIDRTGPLNPNGPDGSPNGSESTIRTKRRMGEEDLMNESEPFGITKAEMSVQRLRQRGQLETRSPLVIPGASSQIRLKEKETTHSSDLSLTDLLPLKKSKKQKREVKKVVPKTSQIKGRREKVAEENQDPRPRLGSNACSREDSNLFSGDLSSQEIVVHRRRPKLRRLDPNRPLNTTTESENQKYKTTALKTRTMNEKKKKNEVVLNDEIRDTRREVRLKYYDSLDDFTFEEEAASVGVILTP